MEAGTSDEMISRSERTQHIKMSHSSIFIRIQNLPIVRSVGQQGWDVEHDLTSLELVVHTVESRAVIWNTVDHQKLYNHRLEECDSFYCGIKTISTVTSTFKNYPPKPNQNLWLIIINVSRLLLRLLLCILIWVLIVMLYESI